MYTISKHFALVAPVALIVLGSLFISPFLASANENEGKKRSGPHAVGSALEIRIEDNNSVLVRGAKVTAVSGSVISAETAFGATVLSWSVRTNANTVFTHRADGSSSLSTILIGDYISFGGTLNTGTSGLTVDAKAVKDWSRPVQVENIRALHGSVQSIDVVNMKFMLASKGAEGVVTVKLATSSVITNGDIALAFAQIKVADQVKVSGAYDSATKTFTATKVGIVREDVNGHKTFKGRIQSFKDRFHFGFWK